MTLLPWLQSLIYLIMATTVNSGCDFTADYHSGPYGKFSSPNFPAPYPGLANCGYSFQAQESGRVRITFSFFELEDSNPDTGCVYDHINIYSVDKLGDRMLLGQLCGSSLPSPVISLHPRLELQFISDYTKSMKGFLGHYEFLDDNWLPFQSTDSSCGHSVLDGMSGLLTSPYPKPHHQGNIECVYLLKREKNQHLLVHFLETKLGYEGGVDCGGGRVELYNGYPTPTSRPDDQVCGQLTSEREFLSKSSRLVIRYISHGADVDLSKFKLIWTQVTLSEDDECEGHLCGPRDYCTENDECNPTLRFCINSDLRCNQIPNCGPLDNSDENMCGKDIAIICVSVLAPLVTLLLIASLTFYYYKKRKVKKSVTLEHSVPPPPPAPHHIDRLQHSPSSDRHCSKILHTSFVDGEVQSSPRRSPHRSPHQRQVTWNLPRETTEEEPGEVIQEPSTTTVEVTRLEPRADCPSPSRRPKPDGKVKKVDFVPLQTVKRPSYNLMKQTYTDDGGRSVIIAEI